MVQRSKSLPYSPVCVDARPLEAHADRKSTRLNSSHANISYAVFCLKKKKKPIEPDPEPDGIDQKPLLVQPDTVEVSKVLVGRDTPPAARLPTRLHQYRKIIPNNVRY